jgi:hypothetical protein
MPADASAGRGGVLLGPGARRQPRRLVQRQRQGVQEAARSGAWRPWSPTRRFPGHHLQTARAIELGELPKSSRLRGYDAYGEGWALYAETLGFDLGLYRDPNSRFGHLQGQAFRAARLVVDTGLHAMGWSRQQAIDFMVERDRPGRAYVASEVDRYLSWPGQALGYMVGQLKIVELRDPSESSPRRALRHPPVPPRSSSTRARCR